MDSADLDGGVVEVPVIVILKGSLVSVYLVMNKRNLEELSINQDMDLVT